MCGGGRLSPRARARTNALGATELPGSRPAMLHDACVRDRTLSTVEPASSIARSPLLHIAVETGTAALLVPIRRPRRRCRSRSRPRQPRRQTGPSGLSGTADDSARKGPVRQSQPLQMSGSEGVTPTSRRGRRRRAATPVVGVGSLLTVVHDVGDLDCATSTR